MEQSNKRPVEQKPEDQFSRKKLILENNPRVLHVPTMTLRTCFDQTKISNLESTSGILVNQQPFHHGKVVDFRIPENFDASRPLEVKLHATTTAISEEKTRFLSFFHNVTANDKNVKKKKLCFQEKYKLICAEHQSTRLKLEEQKKQIENQMEENDKDKIKKTRQAVTEFTEMIDTISIDAENLASRLDVTAFPANHRVAVFNRPRSVFDEKSFIFTINKDTTFLESLPKLVTERVTDKHLNLSFIQMIEKVLNGRMYVNANNFFLVLN